MIYVRNIMVKQNLPTIVFKCRLVFKLSEFFQSIPELYTNNNLGTSLLTKLSEFVHETCKVFLNCTLTITWAQVCYTNCGVKRWNAVKVNDSTTKESTGHINKWNSNLHEGCRTSATFRQVHRVSPFSCYITGCLFVTVSKAFFLYAGNVQTFVLSTWKITKVSLLCVLIRKQIN